MHALFILSVLSVGSTALTSRFANFTKRAEISAFDLSAYQGAEYMSCMADQGFSKVVIRGYEQDCSTGGSINPDFVEIYTSAKAAGLRVDSYFFPCTGTQPTGIVCKDMGTQLEEFLSTISENDMELEYLWLDVEPTSGECNAWNMGAEANTELALQWVATIQATGYQWGIYGNGEMFPSQDTDIGSSLPLWACQPDESPDVPVTTLMGGWTSAFAKQYSINTDDSACGGSIDLDTFSA